MEISKAVDVTVCLLMCPRRKKDQSSYCILCSACQCLPTTHPPSQPGQKMTTGNTLVVNMLGFLRFAAKGMHIMGCLSKKVHSFSVKSDSL